MEKIIKKLGKKVTADHKNSQFPVCLVTSPGFTLHSSTVHMYTHHTAVLYTESFHEFRQVWCDDLVNGCNNEELQIGLIIVCYGSWLSNQQAQ